MLFAPDVGHDDVLAAPQAEVPGRDRYWRRDSAPADATETGDPGAAVNVPLPLLSQIETVFDSRFATATSFAPQAPPQKLPVVTP